MSTFDLSPASLASMTPEQIAAAVAALRAAASSLGLSVKAAPKPAAKLTPEEKAARKAARKAEREAKLAALTPEQREAAKAAIKARNEIARARRGYQQLTVAPTYELGRIAMTDTLVTRRVIELVIDNMVGGYASLNGGRKGDVIRFGNLIFRRIAIGKDRDGNVFDRYQVWTLGGDLVGTFDRDGAILVALEGEADDYVADLLKASPAAYDDTAATMVGWPERPAPNGNGNAAPTGAADAGSDDLIFPTDTDSDEDDESDDESDDEDDESETES